MELREKLRNKLDNLISFLKEKKVIVAFSGGIDSSLLAFISKKYAKDTLLITERSILYPEEEIEESSQFAKKFGISHMIIERDPLEEEDFQCNPLNRCYICKTGLYNDILEIKNLKNFDVIIDGSNADDLSDYRPGMQALKELKISTPYIDLHEESLARIEFLPEDLPNILTANNMKLIRTKLKELGFTYVTIDIEGFRSGSMNEVLDLN